MLQAARNAVESLQGASFARYLAEENLRLATERRIEILGEAARRVSEPFQKAHPEIPWGKVIAQRNVLIHEYGEVEHGLVWAVVKEHIPDLILKLEPLVPPPPAEPEPPGTFLTNGPHGL